MNEEMKRLIEGLNGLGYKVESVKDLNNPYAMKDLEGHTLQGFDLRISRQTTDDE